MSVKSSNILHLTRHCRLINSILAGLSLFPQTSLRITSKAESWPSSRLIRMCSPKTQKNWAAMLLLRHIFFFFFLKESKKKKVPWKLFSLRRRVNLHLPCLLLWQLMKTFFFSRLWEFITAMHLQSWEPRPAVIMGCVRAAATTSKLLPPPSLPG